METVPLARIEEEITRQKLILSNLYHQRNRFSLVFRLPNEILSIIFIHCARSYYHGDRIVSTSTKPPWSNVSYVCRHWRDVALNCPTLWTYITVMPRRWTEELLARSKTAPLKIRIGGYRAAVFLDTVERAMSMNSGERIQELSLELPRSDINNVFSKLTSSAPRLQTLRICVEDLSYEMSLIPFGGDTPALRTLELKNCPAPWYLLKLSGLTTLSLRGHLPTQCQQRMEEFLSTLSRMPHLEYLYLIRALPSSRTLISSAVFKTLSKINLPRLSRIWIDASLSTVITLLSCVVIPPNIEARLECDCECDLSLDDYALLSSVLAQRYGILGDQETSTPMIRSLVIDSTWVGQRFTFSELEHGCSSGTPQWDCGIPLQILIAQSRMEKDRVISDMCCALPLPHVQSLHVLNPLTSAAFWTRTFCHFQDLRYIKLSQGIMPEIASLLSLAPTEKQGNQSPNRIFVPALEKLELCDMMFGSEPLEWGDDTLGTDLESLHIALATRKTPPVQLVTANCYTESDIESSGDGSHSESDEYDPCFCATCSSAYL